VLTGFMATGKSVVGGSLADALGYGFVDTDSVIEERHGPIEEIFRTLGEGAFREMERELANELAAMHGVVIATGGGMLLNDEVASLLGSVSRIFCLTAEPEEILRRVEEQASPERPLLAGSRQADKIAALLASRAAAYARFEQVPTDGRSIEEIVGDILGRVGTTPASASRRGAAGAPEGRTNSS